MSTGRINTVELHGAWTWDCDACGAEQFERGVVVGPEALDPEDAEELGDFLPGEFYTHPDAVVCRECGAAFTVEMDDENDEDEDESS